MRYVFSVLYAGLLVMAPTSVMADVWHYACAEAITLLKQEQREVSRRQDHLRQAKLALKILPKELEACRTGQRGFEGGYLYCVRHRSHGWNGLKEVLQAEQALNLAIERFEERSGVFTQACRTEK